MGLQTTVTTITSQNTTASSTATATTQSPTSVLTDDFTNDTEGYSKSVIIGASIGAALGSILVGWLAMHFYKKYRRQKRARLARPSSEKEWAPAESLPFGYNMRRSRVHRQRDAAELDDTGRRELEDTARPAELESKQLVYELGPKISLESANLGAGSIAKDGVDLGD